MNLRSLCALLLAPLLFAGCATSSGGYDSLESRLANLPVTARAADVSLLLGASPSRCELVQDTTPKTGILLTGESPVIRGFLPGSPAETSGLRVGDVVTRLAGQTVSSANQFTQILSIYVHPGDSIELETTRGKFTLRPWYPKVQQCSWDVETTPPPTGAAPANGSAPPRRFKATCRIYDDTIVSCASEPRP